MRASIFGDVCLDLINRHKLVAVLDRVNVDTHQIIPKQFLKRIERSGFGQFLFYDWRFEPDGKTLKSDFELNDPPFSGSFDSGLRGPQSRVAPTRPALRSLGEWGPES